MIFAVCAWIGFGLLVMGGLYAAAARRPVVKQDPYLGLKLPGRLTARLTEAAPLMLKVGTASLLVGVLGLTVA